MPKGTFTEEFDLNTYDFTRKTRILTGKDDAFKIFRKRRKKILALKQIKTKRRGRHARRKSEDV